MIESPVRRNRPFLCAVSGTFYRAIDPRYAEAALLGSHKAGRYSRPDQPTLYLSASLAGVEAAMIAHQSERDHLRSVLSLQVDGANIFDLRKADALIEARNKAGDPFADWQSDVARGCDPSSWRVREWIEAQGAYGLIDPSRKAPGLWHLVLFRWNAGDAPTVRL